ncbi:MAG: phosphoribosylformylglycinamidine synthase I [Anaerolineae bacterium]
MRPRVLVLQATGTNRDGDAAEAVRRAGGDPEILHVNELREHPERLHTYQMLILPGGFSYGDALGAGKLLATDMRWLFQDALGSFVEAGKPILGICNGFQALVKSGWLPGPPHAPVKATLTRNVSNRFECRWVWLEPTPDSRCIFTRGLTEPITCPVAHGEGRFVPVDEAARLGLWQNHQVALTYTTIDDSVVGYPQNPNGSTDHIAGICNAAGTILGLMPHPEDHIYPRQHPRRARGDRDHAGLPLFERGIAYAASL